MNADLEAVSRKASAALRKLGVQLTLGGEPSYVPEKPEGAEWSITALGPTKLRYGYALAEELIREALPIAATFFSPGKTYPGETNPRWAIHLLWNRDGSPLVAKAAGATQSIAELKRVVLQKLKLRANWIRARDPAEPKREVWVLPLDHNSRGWRSAKWPLGKRIDLLPAEGPAGLRLPLNLLSDKISKRALILEEKDGRVHAFLPPLLQKPFLQLVRIFELGDALRLEGYIPGDDLNAWSKISVTPDPGVLEINLPPCADAAEYARWIELLDRCTRAVGLRSYKQRGPNETGGTGGGNHLLFGAPTPDTNAFFTRPAWLTSILRYWQRHPSLSYLFTGDYVGPSSQAPRPDESSRPLYDLEMAYQFLESLPRGKDQRYLISETLRHLHTDGSGNTHRSEISFDKLWNASWDGGCRGLIEFRAVETMPDPEWMCAVATLWQSLAAMLLRKKDTRPLLDHGHRLHDYYFLPTLLWRDFADVLADLRASGFDFSPAVFESIWNWRFPQMLSFAENGAQLTARKALEGWPLLCETPLEGGTTSRFVDTSMERIELVANRKFFQSHEIFVEGRKLPLAPLPGGSFGAGLRYRRTALHPSLHPGIAPHMPLHLTIVRGRRRWNHLLKSEQRFFQTAKKSAPRQKIPCKKLKPELLTYDLRIE